MDHSTQNSLNIREVEVSITAHCTLACENCGFFVPAQPAPSHGEPIGEISEALKILYGLGVRIESLAILGGEPTIDGALLERAVYGFVATRISDRIEVVTNGLTPRGLTEPALRHINRLSISDYGLSGEIINRYNTWLQLVAPHVEIIVRTNESGWDPLTNVPSVSVDRAQEMFDACWYRRHCVTIERGHLFVCSRIAKLEKDAEGLPIDCSTTLENVKEYILRTVAMPSCATCTQMMGLPSVPAGVQPDNRIQRFEARAITWLDAAIQSARSRVI